MTLAIHVAAVHDSIDVVLTTTRTVRKRLDLTRPVERAIVEAWLELALQAPTGANRQDWRFVAVDDPETKQALAHIYRTSFVDHYGVRAAPSPAGRGLAEVADSAHYLAENLHRVPVLLVPYRIAPAPTQRQAEASFWASILPAAWSFMLAARSRGLVTAYTARANDHEDDLAHVLGLAYPDVTQAGLIAVAYPDRPDFRPAMRQPVDAVLRWNHDA
jgi:nitroreductase